MAHKRWNQIDWRNSIPLIELNPKWFERIIKFNFNLFELLNVLLSFKIIWIRRKAFPWIHFYHSTQWRKKCTNLCFFCCAITQHIWAMGNAKRRHPKTNSLIAFLITWKNNYILTNDYSFRRNHINTVVLRSFIVLTLLLYTTIHYLFCFYASVASFLRSKNSHFIQRTRKWGKMSI